MLGVWRHRGCEAGTEGTPQVSQMPDASWMEGRFQAWLVEAATGLGYLVKEPPRASRRPVKQRGNGWPDLMFVGKGRIFWAELKAGKNELYDNQRFVIDRMRANGATVFVWYPKDAEMILSILAAEPVR